MVIQSLELADFRNYETLGMEFSEGTNILYGDNAQGKTNILESLYMISTTRSHRGVRDRDLIRFGQEEGHIRVVLIKNGIDYKIDMHLRKNRSKGIAINGQRIKKASELIGLLHIVLFSGGSEHRQGGSRRTQTFHGCGTVPAGRILPV